MMTTEETKRNKDERIEKTADEPTTAVAAETPASDEPTTEVAEGGASRRRKIFSAAMALILGASLLVSGTYALETAKAYFSSEPAKHAVAHNDFSGTNHDIYFENVQKSGTATASTNVFVRIKIEEKLTINGVAQTPVVHKQGCAEACHGYYTWTMGNAAPTYRLSATDSRFSEDLAGDTNDKTDKIYMENGVAHDNTGAVYTEASANKLKIPACTIITMDEYMHMPFDTRVPRATDAAKTKKGFTGWVCDADGWYYWSQPIEPGNATGLLVDQVVANGGEGSSTCQLEVTYEAVDHTDVRVWTRAKTTATGTDGNTPQAIPAESQSPMATFAGRVLIHTLDGAETEDIARVLAEQDAATSPGAYNLYDQALKALDVGLPLIAKGTIQYNANGTPINSNYTFKGRITQARETEEAYRNNIDNCKNATVDLNDLDPAIKAYILATYPHNADNTMTKDQAKAVTEIRTQAGVSSFSGLTAAKFPNLDVLQCRNSNIGQEQFNELDKGIKNQLVVFDLAIECNGSANAGGGVGTGQSGGWFFEMKDLTHMKVFIMDGQKNLTGGGNLGDACQVFSTRHTPQTTYFQFFKDVMSDGRNFNMECLNFKGSPQLFVAISNQLSTLKYVDVSGVSGVRTFPGNVDPRNPSRFDDNMLKLGLNTGMYYLNAAGAGNLENSWTVQLNPNAFTTVEPIADGWYEWILPDDDPVKANIKECRTSFAAACTVPAGVTVTGQRTGLLINRG